MKTSALQITIFTAAICLGLSATGFAAEPALALQAATSIAGISPTHTDPTSDAALQPDWRATTTRTPVVTTVLQDTPVVASVLSSADVISERIAIAPRDHTAATQDIWERLRNGFAMRELKSPIVDDRMRYYLARPQQFTNMLERGRKYMFHIVSELEKRGMPTELALLPIVESAYNPLALSSAKAAGLWQFIPSTGRDYQLTQNWWVDERRDVIASTDAALKYLQTIYEMHGDWQLALASYNWGENAVARAVARNKAAGKPADYLNLTMPTETRFYVPKLQALKNIIANPEAYNIALPKIPDAPYFTSVPKRQGMDVALAAKLAEMPLSELLMLNPGYNRPVMPGSSNAAIVLPVDSAQKFASNLANHDAPLVTWKTYSVPRTERIEQVAKRLRLAVQELCAANGLRARALLKGGYQLLIPAHSFEVFTSSSNTGAHRRTATPSKKRSINSRSRKRI